MDMENELDYSLLILFANHLHNKCYANFYPY